jgi:hypothetical protein
MLKSYDLVKQDQMELFERKRVRTRQRRILTPSSPEAVSGDEPDHAADQAGS